MGVFVKATIIQLKKNCLLQPKVHHIPNHIQKAKRKKWTRLVSHLIIQVLLFLIGFSNRVLSQSSTRKIQREWVVSFYFLDSFSSVFTYKKYKVVVTECITLVINSTWVPTFWYKASSLLVRSCIVFSSLSILVFIYHVHGGDSPSYPNHYKPPTLGS